MKVSIVRFKPKPECFDEFLNNIKERSEEEVMRYVVATPDEVVAIAFRAEEELVEDIARGVEWLDTQRHLLLQYSEEDKHTIPLTGTLVHY
jgi:hypothetical protein